MHIVITNAFIARYYALPFFRHKGPRLGHMFKMPLISMDVILFTNMKIKKGKKRFKKKKINTIISPCILRNFFNLIAVLKIRIIKFLYLVFVINTILPLRIFYF